MRVLFDHSAPRGIARFLQGHTVTTAKELGWNTLANGDLLNEAERAGFDVVLTADKSMRYQQNLAGRRIALIVLSTTAMADRSVASRKNCGSSRCHHARQLC